MASVARDRGGPRVDALYNLMQSYENKLGGGEGIEGLYGSITQASMQKVIECLKHNSALDHRSVFIDIGAGLGRPLLHALVAAGVSTTWGVELDRVKCDKAAAFCEHVIDNLKTKEMLPADTRVPAVICSPIEKIPSLDPATHAYSFWEGVPGSGKQAFGQLFAASRTLRAVAVVQRAMRGQEPAAVMRDLGFGPVLLIASFPVKMSGSGRSFTAYVFTKIAPAAATFLAHAAGLPSLAPVPLPPPSPTAADVMSPPQQPRQQRARPGAAGAPRRAAAKGSAAAGKKAAAVKAAGSSKILEGLIKVASCGAAADEKQQQRQKEEGEEPCKQPQTGSPSKARRPDGQEVAASPTKKPCSSPDVGSRPAACGGSGGDQEASDTPQQQPQLPGTTTTTAAAAARRGGSLQQRLLTSVPEYSRRTKQAAQGKAGKDSPDVPRVVGTRSSQRLAAKLQAAMAESPLDSPVEGR
ncbi:hypothetical protein Agub_g11168 [Astrephomene gubernaculifera]|uniref:DOT1 domain-containing protein n=1 Tax=Astrephomene gubernaculifera TaxID=47775 RepID=A0AAD3DW20_9CHLO|nr:hypothetical protein Agub_g11168 [Astrephomene gubernaculifera]